MDDEEPTILDLRVEMDEAIEAAMTALINIAKQMKAGAQADLEWQADAAKQIASGLKPKEAQYLVNAKARDFGDRARQLRPLIAAFRTAGDDFFDRLGAILQLQLAQGISTPKEVRASIAEMSKADAAARAARDTYLGVATALAKLPEATHDSKRQKRTLTSQIDQLNTAIASWLDRSERLRQRFDNPRGGPPENDDGDANEL